MTSFMLILGTMIFMIWNEVTSPTDTIYWVVLVSMLITHVLWNIKEVRRDKYDK